jgi:hypothetical protein
MTNNRPNISGSKQQNARNIKNCPVSLGSSRVLVASSSSLYQTSTLEFTGSVSFSTISKQ